MTTAPTVARGALRRARGSGRGLLIVALALGVSSADRDAAAETAAEAARAAYEWRLPAGFRIPLVPVDNPMTAAKVDLGKRLFTDTRLSANGTYSCASCHMPSLAFTDGRPRAVGVYGDLHARNTPTLINVAYNASYGWTDAGLASLEAQHRVPLTSTDPVEMGFGPPSLDRINADATITRSALDAFGVTALDETSVVQSLAAYLRTLIRADSPFDRYLFEDDVAAVTDDARAGFVRFNSAEFGCSLCHVDVTFSGPVRHERASDATAVFHVTGVSGSSEAFRAPTLRNLTLTAPYMHDGSMASLDDVLDFYAAGGGDVPGKREELTGFTLDARARRDLLAFLTSLSPQH